MKHIRKISSKLNVEADYKDLFLENQQRGKRFFRRVCEIIRDSVGDCVAVDRADKKTGGLVSAWSKSEGYREFKDASIAAAKQGIDFKRLFIMESKVPLSEWPQVKILCQEFLEAGVNIGFLFRDDANLQDIEDEYDSDFIIVGITDTSFINTQSVVGFEIRAEGFHPDSLEMNRNLIAKDQLKNGYDLFNTLWNSPKVIIPKDSLDKELEFLNALVEQ